MKHRSFPSYRPSGSAFRHGVVGLFCAIFAAASLTHGADPWVTYEGQAGPGLGQRIVLVSGDEEYRSEEALPQLGKILAERHGFTCTVLFAIDPDTGVINPDNRTNIPGLEALADADLMIIATRFRDLPDEQMAHIDAYVQAGKPIIGLRTSTHAFNITSSETYKHYTWNHQGETWPQGFGRQILGETWVAHHGAHGSEATRGVIPDDARDHPINRGVVSGDIFGPTDVYTVRLPLPEGRTPVVLGEVVAGMNPSDPPVDNDKNRPMMPISWTGEHNGGRVFTTTMGAATDFVAPGTRRMLVNAVYWCLGLEDAIPPGGTDVRLVGDFDPTPFGFGGFIKDVRPEAHAFTPAARDPEQRLDLPDGTQILVAGNTFAERLAQTGYFDAAVHAAFPDREISIRHVPGSADEVASRPRETNVPTMMDWMDRLQPDVVFLAFGMSESFDGQDGLDRFRTDLSRLIEAVRDRAAPDEIVLWTPVRHENLGRPWPTGQTLFDRNAVVAAYADAMQDVAAMHGVRCVDLFDDQPNRSRRFRTTNGIHPNDRGAAHWMAETARQLGWGDPSGGTMTDAAVALRELCADKHYYWRLRYRATNTEYVWGRRANPFGVVNFPPEMEQLERMVAAREAAVWAMDKPSLADALAPPSSVERSLWSRTPSTNRFEADDWSPPPVEAKGTETSLGDLDISDPEDFKAAFTVPDGYVIECFASELEFEALQNPLAMTFDERHRLWVLCAPTYPHLMPGARARCRLIILEDTDDDGRADTQSVFADELYVPTGFALDGVDTAYVGQAPDLLRLRDTDGDGRADVREIVASGFGMPDSHHTLSAFEWDPNGGFVMHEGVFTKSSVETPWGTWRTRDAATWRFDPRTQRVVVMSHSGFSNPWGHVFDDYGQSILADASGGDNVNFAQVVSAYDYPRKPGRPGAFLNRGRPTAGCELIASRHFPDDVQNSFLVNQSIGFHGVRWDRIERTGSTWTASRMPQDLVASSDTNFRPVAMEIGPDGALYLVDWCNPIIGHMQYSVRDPRRDHMHGRIWRVRHADRDLVQPPNIASADAADLLEMLRKPERNTRQLARRKLQRMAPGDVLPVVRNWLVNLKADDPLRDRLTLEGLWIHQSLGRVDLELLQRVMGMATPEVRAAAIRVIRHWIQNDDLTAAVAAPLLEQAADDDDMWVRQEAVVAAGFLPSAEAGGVLAAAATGDMDEPFEAVLNATMQHLRLSTESPTLRRFQLERLPADELVALTDDDIAARAMLTRNDLPTDAQEAALTRLAGDDASARVELLLDEIEATPRAARIEPLAALLMSAPVEALNTERERLQSLAADGRSPAQRHVGWAARIRAMNDATGAAPSELVGAMALLPPGAANAMLVDEVRDAFVAGAVDPHAAVEQIVRHGENEFDWLAAQVQAGAQTPFSAWDATHERGMAALRGMHLARDWPDGYDAFRVAVASDDVMARGEEIYHDDERGCVRCHAADGLGVEGFPPLAQSPWVLGDPQRAAGIVVHGLYGPLTWHDGREYSSAMAPLGANLNDDEIAAVLTFVRQSWGNFASPVEVETVAAARADVPAGMPMWSTDAILASHPMTTEMLVAPAALENIAAADGDGGGAAPPAAGSRTNLVIGALVIVGVVIVVVTVRARKGP